MMQTQKKYICHLHDCHEWLCRKGYDMQKATPEIDKLYQDVLAYRESKSFAEFLSFIKRFRRLAPYNAMLLHIQKPGSVYVATAAEWRDRFDRSIKPGVFPLLILKPFGPVSFVYEYHDTEGKPLPDELINPFKIKQELPVSKLDRFIRNLNAEGVYVMKVNFGTSVGGCLRWDDEQTILSVPSKQKIEQVISHHSMFYNENLSTVENFATLLHEAGHLYCGHLYCESSTYKWLPRRYNIGMMSEQREFEAETVCWIICERMGIRNPSASYLAGYLEKNNRIPNISIDAVLKAAGFIESLTEGIHPCRKELIIKSEDRN